MKRGDVYYVRKDSYYDSVGSEMHSGRPAVIVSTDYLNKSSNVVEVVYLTTQPKTSMQTHIVVHSPMRESTALCEQITSISTSRLGDYMCTLTDDEMELIDNALCASLGLKTDSSDNKKTDPYEVMRIKAERDCYKQMLESLIGTKR